MVLKTFPVDKLTGYSNADILNFHKLGFTT